MRELAVHQGTIGLADDALRPGRTLVLEVPFADAVRLPAGVALDDYIPDGERAAVDADALSQLQAWRHARAADVTSDGIDLANVWEVELLAGCFLPFARLRAALPHVVAQLGPQRLVGVGLAPQMLALLSALGDELGLPTVCGDGPGGSVGAFPRARTPRIVRLVGALGVPARVRGSVVWVSYWPLAAVLARLVAPASPVRPIAYGLALPSIGRPDQLRAAWQGGWLGHPSARARARSRAQSASLLDGVVPDRAPTPAGAVDALALHELRRLSPETFALARQARRGFATRRPRLVVVPFDSPDLMRILLSAAHEAGVSSLLVQHGFDAALNDPDKSVAQHMAVWSERDRVTVERRCSAAVSVTGNPGAARLATRAAPRAPTSGRSLVLVEYPSRTSVRVRARVSSQHTSAALAALEVARPHSVAVVRPHPADPAPATYLRLAAAHPRLTVEVDAATPIEALLATADLCVGALSTATLQAAVLGVPVVFFDVAGLERPWPFDGGGGLPRADDPGQLADLISAALIRREVAGREAASDALGVRADAVDRVCALVEELVG